jgi:ATP-dependent Clp protease ATP-binding subunit ClpA
MQTRGVKEMFEQYTPEARRSIAFAYAASQLGSLMIGTEDLLLGLVRENIALMNRFVITEGLEDSFRSQIMANPLPSGTVPTGLAEMLFTDESKRVLSFAAEDAERMGHQHVGIEHLLLGLLREEDCFAARMLRDRGADIERIRKELAATPHRPPPKEERIRREIDEIREIWTVAQTRASANLQGSMGRKNVFGRYTAKADRLILFAKYTANRLGSPMVETEHLLLAVLREEKAHFKLFLPLADSRETICRQIEEQIIVRENVTLDEKLSTLTNLPVSDECKRALDYADEEATRLGSEHIGPEHLLLGMLREKNSYAARILREHGADLERIRREMVA